MTSYLSLHHNVFVSDDFLLVWPQLQMKFQTHIYLFNHNFYLDLNVLTHWGRVTHICVAKITIIVSDNGLSPERRQAII